MEVFTNFQSFKKALISFVTSNIRMCFLFFFISVFVSFYFVFSFFVFFTIQTFVKPRLNDQTFSSHIVLEEHVSSFSRLS